MAQGLLGYWPGKLREPTTAVSPLSRNEEIALSSRQNANPALAEELDIFRLISPVNGSILSDKTHYDTPESPRMCQKGPSVSNPSSAIESGQPLIKSENDTGGKNWRKSQPPKELFDIPDGTPLGLLEIVVLSVEKLQQQFAEEKSLSKNVKLVQAQELESAEQTPADDQGLRVNELQVSRPLKPNNRDISTNRSESRGNGSCVSDTSVITASSNDSGYVSGLSGNGLPKGRIGGLFRFGSALGRSRDMLDVSKQIIKRSGSTSTATKHECVSCLDNFKTKDLVPLSCHSYCKPCFQSLISTALASEDQWPPKCCLNVIPTKRLLPHLTSKDKKRYMGVLEERSVPIGERIYCSKPSCAVWIPAKNIEKSISCAACPSCRQKTCTSCRDAYHANGECPRDPNLQATLQLASDECWRRCHRCNAIVEHNQGCIHMTCKCKAEFCYVCGLQWRTCNCSDQQLEEMQQEVNKRKLAAQAATSAAEMREIDPQIENYEIEEAIRQAREEEEIRMAAVASRERWQAEQVIAVSKKYFELRNELEFMNDLQRVAMTERYEEEIQTLRRHDSIRAAMLNSHAIDLQLAEAAANAKISDSQFRLEEEYHARLLKVRLIENQYAAELKAYWEDRPGGAEKIKEGKNTLRDTHAESYRKWAAKRRIMHQQVIDAANEEVTKIKRQQEMELAANNYTKGCEEDIQERRGIDNRWFEAVVDMRVKMLELMEEKEYALCSEGMVL